MLSRSCVHIPNSFCYNICDELTLKAQRKTLCLLVRKTYVLCSRYKVENLLKNLDKMTTGYSQVSEVFSVHLVGNVVALHFDEFKGLLKFSLAHFVKIAEGYFEEN